MGASDAAKLKSLEDENRRLKKLLAEAMLDVAAERRAWKRLMWPAERREVALRLITDHALSQRRACALARVDPKTVRRNPVRTDRTSASDCAS
jgi:putative transposase